MSYTEDRGWSDAFIPALRAIVGPLLLEESSYELDTTRAADLVVFTAKTLTVACRVRRYGYAQSYPWDFTIRSRRDTGAVTELSKIIDGWADWFIYAHADSDGFNLSRWFVLDLNVFRAALIRDARQRDHRETPNGDGTYFVAYDVRDFPAEIIVSAKPPVPAAQRLVA